MHDDAKPDLPAERRKAPRLPEELLAVMTDSAVASELINRLPEEQRLERGDWVAGAPDRGARARRAVEVVRDALASEGEGQG